jgi:hypothetical protein
LQPFPMTDVVLVSLESMVITWYAESPVFISCELGNYAVRAINASRVLSFGASLFFLFFLLLLFLSLICALFCRTTFASRAFTIVGMGGSLGEDDFLPL